jgi:ATP-dependent helicase STH1/SNF2
LEDKSDEQNDVDDEEELDDEELNVILKRSDQEMAIFSKIDAERNRTEEEAWRRRGGRGKRPERLIQENELPEVYTNDDIYEEDIAETELGRGARVKDHVRYDDGLTEEQWLNVSAFCF